MARPSELEIVRRFSREAPVDVRGAIEALGVKYDEKHMLPDESGRIAASGDGYEIIVNSSEGLQRRRFTAAHELGHYLLHRDLVGERGHLDRLFSTGSSGDGDFINPMHEVQANRFAAEFLMPADLVRSLAGGSLEPVTLAARFGVSPAAMRIRLESLGLRPPAWLNDAPPLLDDPRTEGDLTA